MLGNPGVSYADGQLNSQAQNPLDTRPQPPTCGTKLSLIVGSKLSASNVVRSLPSETQANTEDTSSQADSNNDHQDIKDSDSSSKFNGPEWNTDFQADEQVPMFGQTNPFLSQAGGKESSKKSRKPKNNIVKTSSTFVQKVLPADNLSKRLNERSADGILAFANVNRSFQWLDLTPNDDTTKVKARYSCQR